MHVHPSIVDSLGATLDTSTMPAVGIPPRLVDIIRHFGAASPAQGLAAGDGELLVIWLDEKIRNLTYDLDWQICILGPSI